MLPVAERSTSSLDIYYFKWDYKRLYRWMFDFINWVHNVNWQALAICHSENFALTKPSVSSCEARGVNHNHAGEIGTLTNLHLSNEKQRTTYWTYFGQHRRSKKKYSYSKLGLILLCLLCRNPCEITARSGWPRLYYRRIQHLWEFWGGDVETVTGDTWSSWR